MNANPADADFTIGTRPAIPAASDDSRSMRRRRTAWPMLIATAAVAIAAGIAVYLYLAPSAPPVTGAANPAAVPQTPASPAPAVAGSTPARSEAPTSVPPVADAPGLPALDASDTLAIDAARGIAGDRILALLVPTAVVRNLVATIDALPRHVAPVKVRPLHPVPGLLATSSADGTLTLAATNANRYDAHVVAAEAIDVRRLAGLYARLYPLFQTAYVDLGYPREQFHDRLLAVIDHLLDAPEIPGPVGLIQPKVLYEFADPDLEAMSAGHKIMVRVGVAHERRLKAVLANIRRAVAAGPTVIR